MHNPLRRVVPLLSLALAAAALAAAATDPSSLAVALRAELDRSAAAWNRGDLEGFCASYAEDATFVSPKGVTHGRAEVLAHYRQSYPDRAAMGTLKLDLLEARPAPGEEPSAASVVAHWSLTYPDRPEAAGTTLLVFHRTPGGGWKIVQDASM